MFSFFVHTNNVEFFKKNDTNDLYSEAEAGGGGLNEYWDNGSVSSILHINWSSFIRACPSVFLKHEF